ncbi:hypothetical protein BY996DRAFT_6508988 [Phakopsora pachyrhizi]|nr:hypothetical protein BY996DRAFT_6508988 [Phakopsora pachyrhizi]
MINQVLTNKTPNLPAFPKQTFHQTIKRTPPASPDPANINIKQPKLLTSKAIIHQLTKRQSNLNLNNYHQKHQTKDQPEQRQDEIPIEQSQQSEETLRQSHKTSKHQNLTSTTANPNPKPEPEMRSSKKDVGQYRGMDESLDVKQIGISRILPDDLDTKDNVILLHIGLSASSHAKIHALNKSFGWWEKFIGHGPNYPIGLDWYFVICTNVLGSCYGSTKPSSIDPETNEPMGPISQSSQSLTQSELSSSCWIILVFPNVVSISNCGRTGPSSIALQYAQRHLTTHGKLCHSALIIFDCTTPDHYYLSNCHLIRKSLSTPSFSNLQHFQKRLSSLVSHSPEHQSSLSVQLANHSSAVMDSRTSLKPINDSNNVQNQRLRVNARRPLKDNRRSGKLLTEEEERLAQRLSTGGTSEDPGQTVGLDNGCKQLPETDRKLCCPRRIRRLSETSEIISNFTSASSKSTTIMTSSSSPPAYSSPKKSYFLYLVNCLLSQTLIKSVFISLFTFSLAF